MTKKVKCEVWTRIVGYLRPVDQWNDGKRAEYEERKVFDVPKIEQIDKKVDAKAEV